MFKEVIEWFMDLMNFIDDEPIPTCERKEPSFKKMYDTTPFTTYDYDEIMTAHTEYIRNRGIFDGERKTLSDVTTFLNARLKLNKSRSAYARVWNGNVSRTSLEERSSDT